MLDAHAPRAAPARPAIGAGARAGTTSAVSSSASFIGLPRAGSPRSATVPAEDQQRVAAHQPGLQQAHAPGDRVDHARAAPFTAPSMQPRVHALPEQRARCRPRTARRGEPVERSSKPYFAVERRACSRRKRRREARAARRRRACTGTRRCDADQRRDQRGATGISQPALRARAPRAAGTTGCRKPGTSMQPVIAGHDRAHRQQAQRHRHAPAATRARGARSRGRRGSGPGSVRHEQARSCRRPSARR